MKDCAIVVSTCDGYSDIWNAFFTLFKKYWPDNPFPVYLNSETLDIKDDDISILTLKALSSELSWTRRLKEALIRIDAEYIVFMLDDFFLYDIVDTERILDFLQYMDNDPELSAIYFSPLSAFTGPSYLHGLEKLKREAECKVNLTLALWRKDVLIKCLFADESAWEFEANALDRFIDNNDGYYAVPARTLKKTIPYDYGKFGLFSGKWFRATEELFVNNGIVYDFMQRGFYEDYMFGTIPYVARQIKMDSYIVPCHFLKKDNPRINSDIVVDEGSFHQEYNVDNAQRIFMWHPSALHSFAIDSFKCTVEFADNSKKIFGVADVFGNFVEYKGTIFFLKWGAFVYVMTRIRKKIKRIIIEGVLNKSVSIETRNNASKMREKLLSIGLFDIINLTRINAERLLIPNNYTAFRIYPSLCFDGKDSKKNIHCDGIEFFAGNFMVMYEIGERSTSSVKWEIGANLGGFGLKDFTVELIRENQVCKILQNNEISGGTYIDNLLVCMDAPGCLNLKLTDCEVVSVRISGCVIAPLPRRTLRKIIYGSGRFINLDGLRFIYSTIKRGVKRYGFFGLMIEAVSRIFRRNKNNYNEDD